MTEKKEKKAEKEEAVKEMPEAGAHASEKKPKAKKEEKTVEEEPAKKVANEKKEAPAKQEPSQPAAETAKKEKKQDSDDDDESGKQTLLVETEQYLNTGAHIGTKFKSGDMKSYIYKARKDGLNVLDVQTLDERLGYAAKFLSKFSGRQVVVVSRKVYGQTPAKMFAEATGSKAILGRFVPGTFTNPESKSFIEPKAVLIVDPEVDSQAILEATKVRVPVVAFASTNNTLRNIDLAVPINNKGKKSLALAFWILSREILKDRGEIKETSAFTKTSEDFEYKMKEGEIKRKTFTRKPGWGSRPVKGRGRR